MSDSPYFLPPTPAKEVQVGDFLATRNGWVEVATITRTPSDMIIFKLINNHVTSPYGENVVLRDVGRLPKPPPPEILSPVLA